MSTYSCTALVLIMSVWGKPVILEVLSAQGVPPTNGRWGYMPASTWRSHRAGISVRLLHALCQGVVGVFVGSCSSGEGCFSWTRAVSRSAIGTGALSHVGAFGTSGCFFLHDQLGTAIFWQARFSIMTCNFWSGRFYICKVLFKCLFFFFLERVPFAILLSCLQDGRLKEGKMISSRTSDSLKFHQLFVSVFLSWLKDI